MNNREREWPGQVPGRKTILQIRAGEFAGDYATLYRTDLLREDEDG